MPVIMDDMGSLSACTALRSLTLEAVNPASPIVVSLLSEVTCPRLATITIPIKSDLATLPDFTPLAAPLTVHESRGVQNIIFAYDGGLQRSAMLTKLRRDVRGVHSLRLESRGQEVGTTSRYLKSG